MFPQTFNLGLLTVHYYGLTMALAVLAGWWLARRRAEKFGFTTKAIDDLVFWAILGGFIGARLYHVACSASFYSHNLVQIFMVWHGGLSIYGAVIGGFLSSAIWVWQKSRSVSLVGSGFWGKVCNVADLLTPSLLAGQIIGRLGNWLNFEAYGLPTSLPWKMFVPVEFRLPGYENLAFYHPWFLYEMLGNLIIFVVLVRWEKFKLKNATGKLFFSYLILYNSFRFGLEFLRIDSTIISGLRLNAIVSALLILFGVIGLVLVNRKLKMAK